jgi:CHAT domain-containing protein
LTSTALLELGRHALARNDYDKATWYFQEASYSAVNYPDYGVLEEALRYGALTHLLANRKGLYPPLENALLWAKSRSLRQLRTSLLLCAAENFAALGETRQASPMLDEARLTIGRRTMGGGWLGGRLHFLNATVLFQQRKRNEGDVALRAAMDYMQTGSLRLFQIALVDTMYVEGTATQRTAVDLFGEVLRDPQPLDWAMDPQETLATLATPHAAAFAHWFEAAFSRKDTLGAIEVAERARRHRFLSSLDLGGRLQSLRWLLESPSDALPPDAQMQRQDILARYAAYDQLGRQARAVRTKLAAMPLVAADAAALREQERQLSELANLSSQQEAVLREIAVRREPAAIVFPPLRNVQEVQKSLPEKHAVLGFFVAGSHWYGYLLNSERVGVWDGGSSTALSAKIAAMLRDFGQFQQNHVLTLKDLATNKWKQAGRQMLDALLKSSPADFSHPFDELIIVPDGPLWYVPFAALQVTIQGQPQSLISRVRVRCVPTLSLAMAGGGRGAAGPTAVVAGKLYARDEAEAGATAFQQLAQVTPNAVALRPPLPAASGLYKTLFRRLIVLDDVTISEQDPYGWAPLPVDHGKKGNTLADWLLLPWGGPDTVLLPGCHTAAEDGLKRSHRDAPGNEIFLAVCGLMANGAQTILLSQWRTGGQSSFELLREFAQELPHTSPAAAWQRAVALASDAALNLDAEPRIKHGPNDEAPKASHPFFWAGHLLVDCGVKSEDDKPAAKKPAIQEPVKKADAPPAAQEPPAGKAKATSKGVKKSRPVPR